MVCWIIITTLVITSHWLWLMKVYGKKEFIRHRLRPVHRYPFLFENANFSLQIALPSKRIQRIRLPKTELFKNTSRNGNFWKRRFKKINFLRSCGRMKTELFKNAYVMVWYPVRDLEWRTDISSLYWFCLGFFQA